MAACRATFPKSSKKRGTNVKERWPTGRHSAEPSVYTEIYPELQQQETVQGPIHAKFTSPVFSCKNLRLIWNSCLKKRVRGAVFLWLIRISTAYYLHDPMKLWYTNIFSIFLHFKYLIQCKMIPTICASVLSVNSPEMSVCWNTHLWMSALCDVTGGVDTSM